MDNALSVISSIGEFFLPIFVLTTMFNVGLTQKLESLIDNLTRVQFYIRMILGNFIVVPFIMFLLLQFISVPETLQIGLVIFSTAAGASSLIKLTQFSDHDVALGASLMLILVAITSIYMPIVLQLTFANLSVNTLEIIFSLVLRLIVPIILGIILDRSNLKWVQFIKPWVSKLSNLSLYIAVGGLLIGNIEGIWSIIGEGAILVTIIFILASTAIGYLFGGKHESHNLEDVGALGTGQRNTAAGVIIASNNFSDAPEVLLMIIIATTLGIFMLAVIARLMSENNAAEVEHNENE